MDTCICRHWNLGGIQEGRASWTRAGWGFQMFRFPGSLKEANRIKATLVFQGKEDGPCGKKWLSLPENLEYAEFNFLLLVPQASLWAALWLSVGTACFLTLQFQERSTILFSVMSTTADTWLEYLNKWLPELPDFKPHRNSTHSSGFIAGLHRLCSFYTLCPDWL